MGDILKLIIGAILSIIVGIITTHYSIEKNITFHKAIREVWYIWVILLLFICFYSIFKCNTNKKKKQKKTNIENAYRMVIEHYRLKKEETGSIIPLPVIAVIDKDKIKHILIIHSKFRPDINSIVDLVWEKLLHDKDIICKNDVHCIVRRLPNATT